MFNLIKTVFEKNYDLGEVCTVKKLTGGLVNQSYLLEVKENGEICNYFLRIYIAGKDKNELLYEHGLLEHLQKKGMGGVGGYLKNRFGESYFEQEIDGKMHYWAVQKWLKGEDLYAWAESSATLGACENAARKIAQLHKYAYDYQPPRECSDHMICIKKQVQDFYADFEHWSGNLKECHSQQHSSAYVYGKLGYLKECIGQVMEMFVQSDTFPITHIHTDAHLGNFKFDGDKVTAIFDFDWAKKDFRLYDVAMICVEICTPWHYDVLGKVDMEKMAVSLRAYMQCMKETESPLADITEAEINALPEMMMAGNLFIMHDLFRQVYEDHRLSDFEYLYYMVHQVACLEWIRENREYLIEVVASLKQEIL